MLSYKHFSTDERKCLQELIEEGASIRKISRCLGRSASTVSREIKRNSSKKGYHYWRAQTVAIIRRREKTHRKLIPGTPQWEYIVDSLAKFWSPEVIVERWAMEHAGHRGFGVSTIYRYIARGLFPAISRKTHLRRRGKRRNSSKACYNTIHPDRIIPDWPEEIKQRARIGDWEGDTVYGGVGKGLIVTMVDRKTRFLCSALLDNRDASLTKDAIVTALASLPVESISLDNGSEFSEFHALEKELGTLVYFAQPHKPWQRGTNENTNDILRFFFPKGFDFHSLSALALQKVVDLINDRPRKCLHYLSPREAMLQSCSVALT